ncbi:MAG: PD-(D/E)XK nuclease family protein [Pseudomonadota bacterium]
MPLTNNLHLQHAALAAAAEQGRLVLTGTGRLARHLLHLARLDRAGKTWRRPSILSLNDWMHRAWQDLWPEEVLAPTMTRLRLWQNAVAACPPPSELAPRLSLYSQIDDAYATLASHALSPCGRKIPGPVLAEWRAEVCAQFEEGLRQKGLLHPARLPLMLAEAAQAGLLPLFSPRVTLVAPGCPPTPAEERLLTAVSTRCELDRLEVFSPSPQTAGPARLVSLPRLRDEAEWCARQLLHLQAGGGVAGREVGVVVTSMEEYGAELTRALGELLGERCGEGWSAYNIAAPSPLSEAPLARAALLPLRFLAENEPRELLFALITSPYYGRWRQARGLAARADRAWRERSIEGGLGRLLAETGDFRLSAIINGADSPTLREVLGGFLQGRATLREWTSRLRHLWRWLGFPQMARGDEEANVRNRLDDALGRLESALGEETFDLPDLWSWLEHALGEESMDVLGFEHAGVQVLGLNDAAGLHFSHLLVLGLHERGLPRPVRALPLLGSEERRGVRGGTWEGQMDLGRQAMNGLLASGSTVWLARPRLADDDEPLLPSPLWPEGVVEEETLGGTAGGFWEGFPWLEARQAWQARQAAAPASDDDFRAGVGLPPSVRATALRTLLSCPYAFLMQEILGLAPLATPMRGISPLERGTRLHRAVACFTRRWREEGGSAGGAAGQLLAECVEATLGDLLHDPLWRLESRRWLDDGGLLRVWLKEEGEEGLARCVAEELEFEDLRAPGWPFGVRGRIDRLDAAPGGLFCWDYKTGSRLEPAGAPLSEHAQLAVYGLAVRAGLFFEKKVAAGPLAGLGYVHLSGAAKVAAKKPLKEPEGGWPEALERFTAEVSRAGGTVSRGVFTPNWEGCIDRRQMERCPFPALCGLLERVGERGEGGEETE